MKTTHAAFESAVAAQLGDLQPALPEDASLPGPDVATDVSWALRAAGGAVLVSWGAATFGPVVAAFAHSPIGLALHAAWFTAAVGTALVASGTMLMTNKFSLLAMTLLVPVSVHLLFQFVLLNNWSS